MLEAPGLLILCISSCSGSCTDCIGLQDGVAVLIFLPTLHATCRCLSTFGCCKSLLFGSLICPKQIPILLKLLILSVHCYIIFKLGSERTKKICVRLCTQVDLQTGQESSDENWHSSSLFPVQRNEYGING